MDSVSVFDIVKIGIGPSSSHTMGPWIAAESFLRLVEEADSIGKVRELKVNLYGSLALTGKGHGTDVAVLMGLSGENFETIDTSTIDDKVLAIQSSGKLCLGGKHEIDFSTEYDLRFKSRKSLRRHPNGMKFKAKLESGKCISEKYYSVGGGFVLSQRGNDRVEALEPAPFACHDAKAISKYCEELNLPLPELIRKNEATWRSPAEIEEQATRIWSEIVQCVHRGVQASGILPGGLGVRRRAAKLHDSLLGKPADKEPFAWLNQVRAFEGDFNQINKWISCFALAVNEENAAFGRVVTAPTNGASGVVPAVLMYGVCFESFTERQIVDFILVAGEIGTLFKKNATISGAMGGCQAEVGVSSAMAAAALTACRNGTSGQILMAAEVAMEHHLGMTCDPVAGLVQIPCIERNSMGAIKAITAANLALESDPATARIQLDDVIETMLRTAADMHSKYKETSKGGLAKTVADHAVEC